jgi:hypothetical protein
MIDMRENALPILEEHGVDLVFTGHSHSYERTALMDGHYGLSATFDPATMVLNGGDGYEFGDGAYRKATPGPAPHEGTVYVVSGSSGQTSGGALNHPAMLVSLNVLGSVILDVDGSRLDATFLDDTGAFRDRFTMIKGSTGSTPPPGPVTGLHLAPNEPNPFQDRTWIHLGADVTQEVVLEIFDVSGRKISEAFRGVVIAGEDVLVELDGSSWESGLYFVQLRGLNGEVRRPIILMR